MKIYILGGCREMFCPLHPTLSLVGVTRRPFAHVAQLVEHILGKDEVTSSILVVGCLYLVGI